MQYFATHYWQEDDNNSTSLALHQVYHRRKKTPILLAVVEEGAKGEHCISQRLTEWFYGPGLSLCDTYGKTKMKFITENMKNVLEKQLQKSIAMKHFQFAGIFCMGEEIAIFRKGGQKISLLNTRNSHSNYREISDLVADSGRLSFQTGLIQHGVGVLLASDAFYTGISQKMAEECLNIRELCSQNRADKHLGEIGNHVQMQGGSNVGAVLIVAK